MAIDRRKMLAGLAATASAASLPALAAGAASGVRRFERLGGLIFSSSTPAPRGVRSATLDGLWQFDPRGGDDWMIRHVATGLTCRRAPQEHDRLALQAVCIDHPLGAWPDAATVALIGCASRVPAAHAFMVCGCRPHHKGAVFFHYSQVNPHDPFDFPLTEDAPALSPDSSSGPPRRLPMGNRTVLSSKLIAFFHPATRSAACPRRRQDHEQAPVCRGFLRVAKPHPAVPLAEPAVPVDMFGRALPA